MSRLRELSADGALNADWSGLAQNGDFPLRWVAKQLSFYMKRWEKSFYMKRCFLIRILENNRRAHG